jgi:hypothetical protein
MLELTYSVSLAIDDRDIYRALFPSSRAMICRHGSDRSKEPGDGLIRPLAFDFST